VFYIVTTFVLVVLFSNVFPSYVGASALSASERIENNLIEFKSPAAMFQPDSAQLANPKTLARRMEHYKTPGVSIAVIENNQIAWSRGYGTLKTKTNTPVTGETIFEAASTSKFVTAVLALHFVEEKRINLDTDVNQYLKTWRVPENEFTTDEKVTLRRLLTHQAGLPTTNYDYVESMTYPSLLDVLSGTQPALNKPATPELTPGETWQYSNVGFNVIELLLEDVSGKSFATLASELIFQPLGMSNSTFEYPLPPDRTAREAMPHDADGIARHPQMHRTALAHGGLTTTPADLATFTLEIMQSYHGASERIISGKTARQLFTPQVDLDPRIFGMAISEGLGVFLTGEGENRVFLHPGSNLPGLNCWLVGWPQRRRAIVVMTNGASGEMLAMEIVAAFNLGYR
jgi:CubicO group peptidase (beta-lactamase class C family)